MTSQEFVYLSSAGPKKASPRFGTSVWIGARKGPKGYIFNEDEVHRIPRHEFTAYIRDYNKALNADKRGGADLKICKESDYEAYHKAQEAKSAQDAKKTVNPPNPEVKSKSDYQASESKTVKKSAKGGKNK